MILKDILLDIMFPFPTLLKATKTINEKIEKLDKSTEQKPYSYEYASNNKWINDKVLLDILKNTIENKKILEDKAKSSLIAVTISSTLIINILKFVQDTKDNSVFLTTLLAIVGFLSLLYMIIAGVLSLYSIGEINTVATMYPEDYLLPNQKKKTQIADNIEYNYLINLKRNNFMTTSYRCMISSISLLIAIFIISTLILGLGYKNTNVTQASQKELETINSKLSVLSDGVSNSKQSTLESQKEINNIIGNEKITQDKFNSINATIKNLNKDLIKNPRIDKNEINKLLQGLEKQLEAQPSP